MKELKVLHYYDRFFPHIGGAETHISNIIYNMQDIQFEVITNLLPDTLRIENYQDNCIIKRFGPIEKVSYFSNKFIKASKIEAFISLAGEILRVHNKIQYLEKSDADLIHIHAPALSLPLISFDNRHFRRCVFTRILDFSGIRKPLVLTIHGFHFNYEDKSMDNRTISLYNDYFRRWLMPVREVIVVEKFLFDYLKSYLEKHNINKKLHFIPNSVDTDFFGYRDNRIEGKLKVLYVGRINKSLNYLLDFLKKIPPFVDFDIVGSGYPEDFMEIEKQMAGKCIRLHKNIAQADKLIQLYWTANIVWNPVEIESISRVTLEAMSCGRPVIMIKKGDRTPVINGRTGFLVDKSITSVIEVLDDLNNNEALLQELSLNARSSIMSEYSNAVIIPKIKKIYTDAMELK